MISWRRLFTQQFIREILLHGRQFRTLLHSVLFFLMIVIFFPLTLPFDPKVLHSIAPGLIWIALLLSFFLVSDRIFQQDYEDGVLERWFVSGLPVSVFVFAKIIAHWLLNIVPMLVFCPFFALLFGLSGQETLVLMASLLVGTPTLLTLCALAAAFGSNIKQNGPLVALILLPLTLPVMILGSATSAQTLVLPCLALLLALSLFTITCVPAVIAHLLKLTWID